MLTRPVKTVKRGYNETDTANRAGSQQGERNSSLYPDKITIIIAVVVSFAVFLMLLANAIRSTILQRHKHEAR
ncbi:hypothetical protein PG993_015103 [Apiospora rasikravindrae]|uniref:Uncharacterized protein n=1 Tax=Apiospora rasikravindrae TaxID=990691 RepID=A0ABR1RPM8_9PEZI